MAEVVLGVLSVVIVVVLLYMNYLEIDLGLAEALRDSDGNLFKKRAYAQPGFIPLSFAALERALQKESTVEEVIRISGDVGGSVDEGVDFISRINI